MEQIIGRGGGAEIGSQIGMQGPISPRVMDTTPLQRTGIPKKGQAMSIEQLWKDFFSDPSLWWDNRFNKRNPRAPDYRHKHTKEALWIEDWSNPAWVKAELAAMTQGQAQCGNMRTLCKAGQLEEALHILNQRGILADSDTYVCLLQECINMHGLAEGKQVHSHIIQSGFQSNISISNTLVNMYAKCGSMVDARQVFDRMPQRDTFSWNIIIGGFAKQGCVSEAFKLYEQMQLEGVMTNTVTFIGILNACASSQGSLEKGKEVHAHIIKAGILPNMILETALANMYAKCGNMENAHQVFDNMPKRDVVSWNAMIAGYAQHGCGREALEMYEEMQQTGVTPNRVTFICTVKACASLGVLQKGRKIHADIIKAAIASDINLENGLVDMYAKCKSVNNARRVFNTMARRDVFSWSAMIAGYAQHGLGREAFDIYKKMQWEGVTPNKVTFICILNACASLGVLESGKEVHASIIEAGITPDLNLENVLVDMYAKCSSVKDARHVFDNMAQRDVVSWNSMITGYAQHGCGSDAFNTYEHMMQEGVTPDKVTFICILNVCASLGALKKGKEAHADIIKAGIAPSINLETALADMYAKCGSMEDARQVFNNMSERNVVSWNTMIAGYAQHGLAREALKMYEQMQREGVMPNKVTFICLLSACAASPGALKNGKEVHADIIKAGTGPDIILEAALADMYAKCGSIQDARLVFDNMTQRNVASWNTMIAQYAQHGCARDSFKMYKQMVWEGVRPDIVTFNCIFNACASLGVLEKGKQVHADLSKSGIVPDTILENTLVDMYSKCGSIKDARQVFDNMAQRDVVSWNTMITGYAHHGFGREALHLYEQMQQGGLKPDSITFLSLLSACSHVGLADEGLHYLHSMSRDHGLTSAVEHCGCMVDILGRAGRLDEAEDFIRALPVKPGASGWGALLAACKIHGNVELAELAAKYVLKSDPQHNASYVLLSKSNADAGR